MGSQYLQYALIGVGGVIALVLLVVLLIWTAKYSFRGIGMFVSHLWRFIKGEFKEFLRLIASLLVAPIFAVLSLVCLILFRAEPAKKLGRALREELLRMGLCVWRIFVGHPARLLGLETTIEGLETRLPSVLSGAFGDVATPRTGMFPGYVIESTLRGGGSGARLYVARPDRRKLKELTREGFTGDRVVIKSFSTIEDDALHAIVRESRALDAGRRLGLVLEHVLMQDRFYYVMRHVPGENLRVVTSRLHALSGPEGLSDQATRTALGFIRDLLRTLSEYHASGLWHKDVKPDNVIVESAYSDTRTLSNDGVESLKRSPSCAAPLGRATLVDFGLVTSLRSGMTLTTHGTEFYRDPEMVRQALRGVKVHEVDGVKFDLYAAGAVMYSVLEDAFPAHGVLSPMRKRSPQAAQWIVRRAMAEYDQRYESADDMLADLEALLANADLFSVRPADLPSMGGERKAPDAAVPSQPVQTQQGASIDARTTGPALLARTSEGRVIRLKNWWTGEIELDGELPPSWFVR